MYFLSYVVGSRYQGVGVCLPVLGDVETPLKLEMLLLIVVHEARDGVVVTTSKHAARCLLLLELLDVGGLLISVGSIAANHLRVLGDSDTLSLDDLDVVKTAENLVLDLELGAHGELGTLLDVERLVLEGGLASGGREIDGDGRATRRVHGQ